MTIPSNVFGIAFLVLLVTPGIVWIGVRSRMRGYLAKDGEVSSRILQAFGISVILAASYVLAFGSWLPNLAAQALDGTTVDLDPRWAAAAGLLLFAVVPASLSFLTYADWYPRVGGTLPLPHLGPYRSTPTAWDHAATMAVEGLVRIRIEAGKYVGGEFDADCYSSTYPEPRDLYIARQYEMGDDGKFLRPLPNGAGLWIRIQDGYIVEWETVAGPAGP